MKRLIAFSSLCLLLLVLVPACVKAPPAAPANTTPTGNTPLPSGNQTIPTIVVSDKPGVGDPAPDLQLTDMTGKTVSLADYKGQTVWLNFWATW